MILNMEKTERQNTHPSQKFRALSGQDVRLRRYVLRRRVLLCSASWKIWTIYSMSSRYTRSGGSEMGGLCVFWLMAMGGVQDRRDGAQRQRLA
jgi:hypothetical protein